jgi:hypothetical protein
MAHVPGVLVHQPLARGHDPSAQVLRLERGRRQRLAELAQPVHFQQTIDDAKAESLGEARISLQATVVTAHGGELVDRISVWYANGARALLQLHGRIIAHRDA